VKGSYPFFFCACILLCLCSCFGSRKAIYFDIKKDAVTQIENPATEPVIQPNDLLNITVSSKSPEASEIYNLPMPNRIVSATELNGYLVGPDSMIQFPVIGAIKAAGLTKNELRMEIAHSLVENKLLLDPVVSIRNLNYKVTVLGEVQRPMVVTVPAERITLLEAIGFAGDLTLGANRENVLLIREENNKRIFKVMNLNSNEIFSSPYFYLKPNDVIYVQPNKTKVSNASAFRSWAPVILTALSLATVWYYRFK